MKILTCKSQSGNPHADAAYEAGKADGQAGIVGGGWEYAGGTLEDSYRLGFLSGVGIQPKRLSGGSEQPKSEAEYMDECLEDIRSGVVPIMQMTDELLEEIENALF